MNPLANPKMGVRFSHLQLLMVISTSVLPAAAPATVTRFPDGV